MGNSSTIRDPPSLVCSSLRKQKAFGGLRLSLHGRSVSRSHRPQFFNPMREVAVEYLSARYWAEAKRGETQPCPVEATTRTRLET